VGVGILIRSRQPLGWASERRNLHFDFPDASSIGTKPRRPLTRLKDDNVGVGLSPQRRDRIDPRPLDVA
jgi:hypothetical protein